MANTLIRGTTPTDTFTFETPLDEAEKVLIIYKQHSYTLEKEFNSFETGQTTIDVYLSQEESLAFNVGECKISCIVKFKNGNRLESEPISKIIKETVKKEVI